MILSIILLFLFIQTQPAKNDTIHWYGVTGGWSPPTCNGPASKYHLQNSVNGEMWYTVNDAIYDTLYDFEVDYFQHHRIRVAAYDTLGRMGPFSYPSATFL